MNTIPSSTPPRPRLTRLARIFETILTFGLWLMGAFSVILVLLALYAAFATHLPAGLSQEVDVSISQHAYQLQSATGEVFGLPLRRLDAKVGITAAQPIVWNTNLGVAVVGLIIASAFTFHLRQFVRSLYQESPFIPANTRRLRLLGWLTLAGTIWKSVSGFILTLLVEATTPAAHLIQTVKLEPQPYLIVLALFVIAEVFNVGVELKTEQELTV